MAKYHETPRPSKRNLREVIRRNSAKCLLCNEEIESRHVHDFVRCSCGNIAVDGGTHYIRRIGTLDNYTDTSIIDSVEISND